MALKHLKAELLERLEARDLDAEELRAAAWHLYKCRRCRTRLLEVADDGERLLERLFSGLAPVDAAPGGDYASAFDSVGRALRGRLERAETEAADASRQLAELLAHSPEVRRELALAEARFATWKVAEGLLERCRATWSEDPGEARVLADLALALTDRLPVTPALKADLRARSWAYVGNCLRIASDLHRGAAAFARAHEWLEQGSGDPLEAARVFDLESSLLRARRNFSAAERRLERAARLYATVGDVAGISRVLVKRAMLLSFADRFQEAIEVSRRALALIDLEEQPRLYMSAFFNLVSHLHLLGRYAEAAEMLEEARPLIAHHGGESDLRRMRWFEGVTARDSGDPEGAERKLLEVRGEYVARRNAYDAALVSLDLVILYLEQGRREPVRRMAQEMLSVFASLDVQREAMAAFILFQRAAMAETLTAAVARQVLTAVRRGQTGPANGAEGKPS